MTTLHFPPALPITARVRDIGAALERSQVVIVAGDTGSGKTTQLPKICLHFGRGRDRRIGLTQPRRIAATSVAARIASELGCSVGREVGYQIRFADVTSRDTRVKLMTDGILLAEIQGDPLLTAYDTIILDEAHERTLNIDLLLGTLKTILPQRKDLRLIVSSATLAVDRFSEFFDGAPAIQVSGRAFPVTLVHRPRDSEKNDATLSESVAEVIEEITDRDPRGDILVFLPGEREIRDCAALLQTHGLPRTVVLPLYGRLSQSEQSRIFETSNQRRIVLATNVAETSLTIPGIVYVIDSGLARINRHDARSGVTRLLVEPISQASAEQRKGRAGRTQSGVCFRLYERTDHANRPPYTDPEVLRVGLAGAILQMKVRDLGEIAAFPFLDPPPKRAIDEGHRVLEELGAIDEARNLTPLGEKLAKLPVDPRIGRMILAGEEAKALREVLIIAAALGMQDVRERPPGAREGDAHARFRDEDSDFMSLLKLWEFFASLRGSEKQQRKACREQLLSYQRFREWSDVHQQLSRIAKELGLDPEAAHAPKPEAIHRALLTGLTSRVGTWHPEQRVYLGARQTRFQLHPSSALSKKKSPPWIVAAELTETSQLFARTAARIDPAWLEAIGGAACKRSYGDPNWAKSSGQVMCKEQVTLYGLPIVRDRKVHFGPIDPSASRRLFILHALVRQEYAAPKPPPFMLHNRALFEQLQTLRDRARRSDMLADDHAVALFFEKRIPDDVYSGATFEAWRARAEADDPRLLFLSAADVVNDESDLSLESFPESVLGLPVTYRFDPAEDDDGITVHVPLARLLDLDPEVMEWTIPGFHREKIAQLVALLPARASLAGAIASIEPHLDAIARALHPFERPMRAALAEEILARTGVAVARDAFRLDELPPHLSLRFRVLEGARTLAEGRDLRALQERFAMRARQAR